MCAFYPSGVACATRHVVARVNTAAPIRTPSNPLKEMIEIELEFTEDFKARYADPSWRIIRNATLTRDNFTCQICGVNCVNNPEFLNAHHMTYKHFWYEEPGDMITLCRDCHTAWHDWLKANEDKLTAMDAEIHERMTMALRPVKFAQIVHLARFVAEATSVFDPIRSKTKASNKFNNVHVTSLVRKMLVIKGVIREIPVERPNKRNPVSLACQELRIRRGKQNDNGWNSMKEMNSALADEYKSLIDERNQGDFKS